MWEDAIADGCSRHASGIIGSTGAASQLSLHVRRCKQARWGGASSHANRVRLRQPLGASVYILVPWFCRSNGRMYSRLTSRPSRYRRTDLGKSPWQHSATS